MTPLLDSRSGERLEHGSEASFGNDEQRHPSRTPRQGTRTPDRRRPKEHEETPRNGRKTQQQSQTLQAKSRGSGEMEIE